MKKILLSLFLTVTTSLWLSAQNEFITVWEVPSSGSLSLTTGNSSTTSYSWECITCATPTTGSGSFSTANGYASRTITGLPANDTIRLNINSSGLNRFRAFPTATALLELEQWGTSTWLETNAMFNGCTNLTISATDVPNFSNVVVSAGMFQDCSSITDIPNINSWDMSSVTNAMVMFKNASNFNAPIGNWDVGNVTIMQSMFENCSSFNQDLNNWDVSSNTTFFRFFENCTNFNGNIADWDVSSVTSMFIMFKGCSSFNQDLSNWDVSNVTNMGFLFNNCTSFNQPLNSWDVSNVTNFRSMFNNASSFNQPLDNWDLTGGATSLSSMFSGASSFNQPIGNWDVSNITDMNYLFAAATAFNQDISSWDVSNVTNFNGFMNNLCNATFSRTNYDNLLISWSNQNLQPNVGQIKFQCIDYCNGQAARDSIISKFGWQFVGDNLDCTGCTTPVTSTDTLSACDSFVWIDGNTYTSSNNTATLTFPNQTANGCDSIVTLNLTITTTPVVTVTQNGNTLEATPGFSTYNWYSTTGGSISGANSATYTPTASGSYYADAELNGCIGTSNTVSYVLPGPILVSSITVEGQGGDSTITTNGGTLQMEATVLPMNADNTSFTWAVNLYGSGGATIDQNGLLTATADGTVTVAATANDLSGVVGTFVVTISNQATSINTFATFENLSVYPNPTNDIINIEVQEKLNSIELIDITGKRVQAFHAQSKQLDVSNIKTGIYFLEISNQEKKSIIKIIKK